VAESIIRIIKQAVRFITKFSLLYIKQFIVAPLNAKRMKSPPAAPAPPVATPSRPKPRDELSSPHP